MELLELEFEADTDDQLIEAANNYCLQNEGLFVRKLSEDGEVRGAFLLQRNLQDPRRFHVWDTYCNGFEDLAWKAQSVENVRAVVCYFILNDPHKQFCQLFVTQDGLSRLRIALIKEPDCNWSLTFEPVPVEFFERVVLTDKQTEVELGILTRLLAYN